MRNYILSLSLAAATQVFIPSAHAEEPTLRHAFFSTHTNHNDKDHDTAITINVFTSDRQMKLAHASRIETSSDDGKQYKDESDHQNIPIEVDGEDASKSAAQGFVGELCIAPNGNDTWEFNLEVKLTFSDHTNLVANVDNIKLTQKDACVRFAQH